VSSFLTAHKHNIGCARLIMMRHWGRHSDNLWQLHCLFLMLHRAAAEACSRSRLGTAVHSL